MSQSKNKTIDIETKIKNSSEKNRRTGELSLKARKQLSTLKHYFKIDEINRIVTIPIHHNKASDLFDENFSNPNHPFIKRDFLISISSILHSIPIEYLIDVDVKIDDYEGYNPEIILSSIKDAFELFHYDVVKEKTKANLKVAFLIFVGVCILAWLFYMCSKKFIGQAGDPTHDTIHELVYTVGAVVLWEAVYIIFLPDDEYKDVSYRLLMRVNNVKLLNKNDKVLASIDNSKMSNTWIIETKQERNYRYFLLLSGTTLAILSIIKIEDIVEFILKFPNKISTYVIASLSIVIVIFSLLSSIGSINYYRDRGPFKRLVIVFGAITSLFYILETSSFVYMSITHQTYDIKQIVGSIAFLIVMLLNTICAFRLRTRKKERIKKEKH